MGLAARASARVTGFRSLVSRRSFSSQVCGASVSGASSRFKTWEEVTTCISTVVSYVCIKCAGGASWLPKQLQCKRGMRAASEHTCVPCSTSYM